MFFDIDVARARISEGQPEPATRKQVYTLVEKHGLKAARVGRRLYFCDAWIREFFEQHATIGEANTGQLKRSA